MPNWVVGVFRGYDSYHDRDVELSVESSGRASATFFNRNGGKRSEAGWVRRNQLILSGDSYAIESISNGLKLSNLDDRSDSMELRRNGKFEFTTPPASGGAGTVPNWVVGVFRGYDGYHDRDVELSVESSGRASATFFNRNGGKRSEAGWVRRNQLILSGDSYAIESISDGLKLSNLDDRSDSMELRRNGNFEFTTPPASGGTGTVPSWVVGVFRGYDGYRDRDVELSMESSGRASVTYFNRNGSKRTETGWVRGDQLDMSGDDYFMEQANNGVKLTNLDDRSDWMELKRNGSFEFTRPTAVEWGSRNPFPSWAAGNWDGFWVGAKSDVDIRIPRTGRGTVYVRRTGKTFGVSWESGDRMKFESGYTFKVTRIGDAIRLVNVADSDDTSTFRRN